MQPPTPPLPAAVHTGGPPSAALRRPPSCSLAYFPVPPLRGMGMPRIPTESGVTPIHCSSSSFSSLNGAETMRETLHSEREHIPMPVDSAPKATEAHFILSL